MEIIVLNEFLIYSSFDVIPFPSSSFPVLPFVFVYIILHIKFQIQVITYYLYQKEVYVINTINEIEILLNFYITYIFLHHCLLLTGRKKS